MRCGQRWQERPQSDAERHSNSASPQTQPEGEEEALRQMLYGRGTAPGNLPAKLMRQLLARRALMQLGPLSKKSSNWRPVIQAAPQTSDGARGQSAAEEQPSLHPWEPESIG